MVNPNRHRLGFARISAGLLLLTVILQLLATSSSCAVLDSGAHHRHHLHPPLRGGNEMPASSRRELLFVFGWGSRSATGKSADGGAADEEDGRGAPASTPAMPFAPPSCADCLELSQFVFDDLWEAYPHKQEERDDEEDLVGHTGQRRRMIQVWSELEINAVLDNVCSRHSGEVPDDDQCAEVTEHTRDEIENYVFSNGPEGVREVLCAHLLGVCQLHEVESGGELR